MRPTCNIFLYGAKAYLSVDDVTTDGILHPNGQVLICEASVSELALRIAEILHLGHRVIPPVPRKELAKMDPVQREMGIRGFKKMARLGVMFAQVRWDKSEVWVAFSARNAQDVQYLDANSLVRLPGDASPAAVAQTVLDEWQSRSAVSPS